jgi:hypothetical protein
MTVRVIFIYVTGTPSLGSGLRGSIERMASDAESRPPDEVVIVGTCSACSSLYVVPDAVAYSDWLRPLLSHGRGHGMCMRCCTRGQLPGPGNIGCCTRGQLPGPDHIRQVQPVDSLDELRKLFKLRAGMHLAEMRKWEERVVELIGKLQQSREHYERDLEQMRASGDRSEVRVERERARRAPRPTRASAGARMRSCVPSPSLCSSRLARACARRARAPAQILRPAQIIEAQASRFGADQEQVQRAHLRDRRVLHGADDEVRACEARAKRASNSASTSAHAPFTLLLSRARLPALPRMRACTHHTACPPRSKVPSCTRSCASRPSSTA